MGDNCLLLQVLVLATTAVVFTTSTICNKMIWSIEENSFGASSGVTGEMVMEMGQYKVKTSQRTDSEPVKDLISKLHGATNIQYKHKSFTAVLQPKDLKKVSNYNM